MERDISFKAPLGTIKRKAQESYEELPPILCKYNC